MNMVKIFHSRKRCQSVSPSCFLPPFYLTKSIKALSSKEGEEDDSSCFGRRKTQAGEGAAAGAAAAAAAGLRPKRTRIYVGSM